MHGLELLKRWDKGTNLQEATALFAEATKSDPKFALGFAALADAQRFTYSLTHDKSALDTASANAEEAMRLDPRLTRVQVSWGRIQAVRGDNDLAMFSFERALEIDPNNADVQGAIPRQYERLGRFGDAEAAYHRSLALDPDSMFLHNAYANFLFRQSRYSDAAREWRGVVRIAPDSAVAYVNLGAALFEDGETAEAITIFDRAVKLKPNYQAYSNLGLEYYQEGRYAEAVEELQEALKLAPSSAMTWLILGYVRSKMSGMESAAKEAFRHAIKLAEQDRKDSPRDGDLNAELAILYANIGSASMATQRLETALALSPKAPEFWLKQPRCTNSSVIGQMPSNS